MNRLIEFIAVLLTVAGWVLAEGFWQTVLAVLVPPYAWYIVVDFWLGAIGWVV